MSNLLRFCMITTFYPPYHFGGDATFVHNLSNGLAKLGHKIDIIHCLDSYRLLTHQTPENCYNNHPNITIHGLESPYGFLSPLSTQQTGHPFFKSKKIKHILKKGFDVIHYHNISLVGGPKILEYGKGIKLYTIHEYWLICPTHVLFKFNHAPCNKPRCFLCTLSNKRPPQLWRYFGLLKRSSKTIDSFIAPCRFVKDLHMKAGFRARIEYLPNFIPNTNDISHERVKNNRNLESKPPYFLFVGRLEKIKGLHTIIPLFRNYHKARLIIAGTGNYKSVLQKQAKGLINIEFLGHLSQYQLEDLYKNAVATLVPSICFDISPNVILEAFKQKTAVIVRKRGGMPEMIEESGGGVFYETDTELLAIMDRCLNDLHYRRKLGNKGYTAFQKKWSPDIHIKKYLALINNIMARKKIQKS